MKLLPIIHKKISPTSSHLYSLQVENCGSNSRLVVDEDGNGKFRLKAEKKFNALYYTFTQILICLVTLLTLLTNL